MTVETSRGAEQTISTAKYEVTGRGGKGRELLQRGQFVRVLPAEVVVPTSEGRARLLQANGTTLPRSARRHEERLSLKFFVLFVPAWPILLATFLFLRDAELRQLRRDILRRRSTSSPPCRCGGSCRPVRCRTSSAIATPNRPMHAVGSRRPTLFAIGEDRIVRLDVLGKLLVGLGVVYADGVVGDVELSDGIAALTERLAFGRSPAGEGFREPREHDGALALVIGELMGLAVGARQVEAGRHRRRLSAPGRPAAPSR